MNSNKTNNLAEPAVTSDATTKGYVDMKYYTLLGITRFAGSSILIPGITSTVVACNFPVPNQIICVQIVLFTLDQTIASGNSQLFFISPSIYKQFIQSNSSANSVSNFTISLFSVSSTSITITTSVSTLYYAGYSLSFYVWL